MISKNPYKKKIFYVKIKNKETKDSKFFLFSSTKKSLCFAAAIFMLYHVACLKTCIRSVIFNSKNRKSTIEIDTTIGLFPSIIVNHFSEGI